jgi:hypothetical protein
MTPGLKAAIQEALLNPGKEVPLTEEQRAELELYTVALDEFPVLAQGNSEIN